MQHINHARILGHTGIPATIPSAATRGKATAPSSPSRSPQITAGRTRPAPPMRRQNGTASSFTARSRTTRSSRPIVEQNVAKGDPVLVDGRLRTGKWVDSAGIERQSTEIIASSVNFLSPRTREDR